MSAHFEPLRGERASSRRADESPSIAETRFALGRRIKELRQRRRLSARGLAEQIGVTSGFISQIEAGLGAPSVPNLVKIAGALQVTVGELFETEVPVNRVVRRADRTGFEYPELGAAEDFLYADQRVEVTLFRVNPGCGSGPELYTLDYETEVLFALKGRSVTILEDEEYELEEGDAIHFAGDEPHGFRNDSDSVTEVLVVSVLPRFQAKGRRSPRLGGGK